jgi:hypothetical protein
MSWDFDPRIFIRVKHLSCAPKEGAKGAFLIQILIREVIWNGFPVKCQYSERCMSCHWHWQHYGQAIYGAHGIAFKIIKFIKFTNALLSYLEKHTEQYMYANWPTPP